MAYAALVSLAQTIDQILNQDKDSTFLYEKQQMKCLYENVIFLQAFLEDFPENANYLEGRIRDAANEAEDIIEYFMSKEIGSYYTKKFAQNRTELTLRYDFRTLYYKLQNITEEIDSIRGEVMETKNSVRMEDLQLSDSSVAASSSRLVPPTKDSMVGFDDHLMEIKARLCGESSKLQVIPIFGMGGIGKTTLARNAYDDPLILEHFQVRAWVTVSQDYNAQAILSGLLVSLKAERSGQSNEDIVYKSLKGKRYLIIMDDMWSTEVWDDVRMIFPDDHNGSRIMLTTRLSHVATYPDSSSPLHEMHFMDVDQSWNLLKQQVFPKQNCPLELETIGKTIARSCGGLPLAIILIAGLLSMVSRTQASWESFAEILSLSYIHLPHHLRPCFLYMGGFSEDYEIRVSELIKLWIADGLLKLSGSKSFEEEAEEYLEDLVKRSLVLVIKRKTNGKIKSCSVHDLVRDLCMRKAQEEKFLLRIKDSNVRMVLPRNIKDQRRITIALSNLDCLENICRPTIRAIICFQHNGSLLQYLRNFRLLRILNLIPANDIRLLRFFQLPPELFELFHLRYLAFDHPMEVPAAISKLQNLQTLIIRGASRDHLVLLPLEIWRMSQLRHLISFFLHLLPDPEGATFALENLQTLSVATDFVCTEKILKMIPNIKKLGIFYFEGVYVRDYHLENLVHLHQLEKLKMIIEEDFPFRQKLNPVFPRTLKKLTLVGRMLHWKDMAIVGLLPNLQVLKLRNYACSGIKWETSEGEFPQLKFLLIEESRLHYWITESSHFPILKCLMLYDCWNLIEIPDSIGEIPTLELIEVDRWNKCLVESAKRIQEEQRSWGNEALQVRFKCKQRESDSSSSDSSASDESAESFLVLGHPIKTKRQRGWKEMM